MEEQALPVPYNPVQASTHSATVMGRRKRKVFLTNLRATGQVVKSAKEAGYKDSSLLRRIYNSDPDFKREWDLAMDAAADNLEDEATRRAVQGVDKPVFYKGAVVGYENQRSDQLLMFLLRGNRPDKFGDKLNVEGTFKGTFGVAVLPMTAVSSAAWETVAASHAASLPHQPAQEIMPPAAVTPVAVTVAPQMVRR